jgi:hypothetical protein
MDNKCKIKRKKYSYIDFPSLNVISVVMATLLLNESMT